jgi:hypothetical protein
LIAIAAAYGGLRAFLARRGGVQLILSATAFGIAVSGMHYTAMAGMQFVPASEGAHHQIEGLAASPQILSLVVALLCFVIAAGFLLSLVPEPRRKALADTTIPQLETTSLPAREPAATPGSRLRPTPLGGIGQPPRAAPAPRLPVEGADGTHFIDTADVRSVRADAHYTKVHDGTRERMCPWSISEAEAQLDPGLFGCTAATSWRSRTSPSCARKATARWSSSMAPRRIGCRSAVPRSPRSRRDWASPGATPRRRA